MSLTLSPFRHLTLTTATTLGLGACLAALAADPKPSPKPSGPQIDGAFHKVILDTDRDQDGDGGVGLEDVRTLRHIRATDFT